MGEAFWCRSGKLTLKRNKALTDKLRMGGLVAIGPENGLVNAIALVIFALHVQIACFAHFDIHPVQFFVVRDVRGIVEHLPVRATVGVCDTGTFPVWPKIQIRLCSCEGIARTEAATIEVL
jgi:hypothetical protein